MGRVRSPHLAPSRPISPLPHPMHHFRRVIFDGMEPEPLHPKGDDARGRLLIGETGRSYAMELVKRAYTSGLISFDEMGQRLDIINSARVRADLRPALSDLPDYHRVRATQRLERFWID